ncbi:MAG: hypothetical protein RBU25_11825, partial [Lentisphaeria bacterium]|jgi:hypothetical protein|nr:hypothetical protein [Lentisphaeria bacterium]
MLGWFPYWLKGEGACLPRELPEIPELPERDLICFPDGGRPPEVKSVLGFARERAAELAAARRPAAEPEDRRRELADLLHLSPGPVRLARGPVVEGADGACRWRKFTVEALPGGLLPCCELLPAGDGEPERTVLAVHPGGKAALADRPEVRAWLAAGASVCLADLRHTGETAWEDNRIAPGHEASRTALWLGRTLLGEWTEDILALVRLYADAGVAVELAAWGEAGMAALCAAAFAEDIARCELRGLPASVVPGETAPALHMAAYVPRFLFWGDVPELRGLARCPVETFAEPTKQ